MKRTWISLTVALALAAPLSAGVEYEARTWQEGQQANKQAEMIVRGNPNAAKNR